MQATHIPHLLLSFSLLFSKPLQVYPIASVGLRSQGQHDLLYVEVCSFSQLSQYFMVEVCVSDAHKRTKHWVLQWCKTSEINTAEEENQLALQKSHFVNQCLARLWCKISTKWVSFNCEVNLMENDIKVMSYQEMHFRPVITICQVRSVNTTFPQNKFYLTI